MNRLFAACCVLLVAGCFVDPDPPHYETAIPNGLRHVSNGGEQGSFSVLPVNQTSTIVYPVEDGWFCNEFTIVGNDVIGIEIQYGKRMFVDPPVSKRWFYLDTKNRSAKTFSSLQSLKDFCKTLGHESIPGFVRSSANTREISE